MLLKIATLVADGFLYKGLLANGTALDAQTSVVIFFALVAINYIGFTSDKLF